ncbi:MAG: spermidine synthase [Methylophilales bacterium 28-44-11]|nr:MAG: spermidine synthase [Methylophilales bacterium 28-44-11]
MFKFNRKIHKSVADSSVVEVTELEGVRSLHLGSVTVQSSMRVKEPFALELPYSRGMMGFLLFKQNAQQVLTIGLGGGSVPKYIWQYCPELAQTVVEINPQVIQIARSHFYVPEDDARLQILQTDGIAYLQEHLSVCDVLMIDAFDSMGIPPDFCTQAFFDDCAEVLRYDGIFVINLWGSDKNFDIYLQRIEQSFQGHVLMLPTGKPGNIVVFGFKQAETPVIKLAQLQARAQHLVLQHRIDFIDLVTRLISHNPRNKLQFSFDQIRGQQVD